MFSIVSKTLFVVVLVCAFLSCYEARPEGDAPADVTPGSETSASGAPDATGATPTPDPSAGTAAPGDVTSAAPNSSSPAPEEAVSPAEAVDAASARRK